jgi:hypothetical protein
LQEQEVHRSEKLRARRIMSLRMRIRMKYMWRLSQGGLTCSKWYPKIW